MELVEGTQIKVF